MPDRFSIISNFLAGCWPDQSYQMQAISGDASFRRYFRIKQQAKSYILMDSPPALEDGERFVAVQQAFADAGLRVPAIMHTDLTQGLLLLEDLGDVLLLSQLTLDNASKWYRSALQPLTQIRQISATSQGPLAAFDRAFLLREMQIFIDWFVKVHLQLELSSAELAILQQTFDMLAASALEQPQAGMHRDYHARNLMLLAGNQLAVIDFQDIVTGPVSYDAVSLLKDCYIRWPAALVTLLRDEFFAELQQQKVLDAQWDKTRFAQSFDWMGLQRHIKVCGIFCRLYHRDQKAGYLADLPRVLEYLLDVAQAYPQLASFHTLISERILPAFARVTR